jgi:DNA modification methylase
MQPYYQDEYATLYHGDWRTVLPELTLPRVDLVLRDPPYGIGWKTNYQQGRSHRTDAVQQIPRKHWPALAEDDKPFDPSPWLAYPQVIFWGAQCFSDKLPPGRLLVWDKRYRSGKSFFLSDAEAAWMKGGYGVRLYAQTWMGISRSQCHPTEKGPKGGTVSLHPTQKPVALMQWCIGLAGRRVQTVLDPYCGSGTTLIAAKALGLTSIGIEIEETYCATAARRLAQTTREQERVAS